jgi:hypothetical protein
MLAASSVVASSGAAAKESKQIKPTGKDKTPVALSAEPAQLEIRQCLPGTLNVGMTNEWSEPVYADVTITPEAPLQVSRRSISSYLPAGYTYVKPVQVSVPPGAAAGNYSVLLESGNGGKGTRERLSVPVSVAGESCIPREQMVATATSYESTVGAVPQNALDGNLATLWHSEYSPQRLPLPQSITLDLGGVYDVSELAYQPRVDGSLNGTITAYNVYASSDGQNFNRVATGSWPDDSALKFSKFSAIGARYIRLEATGSHEGKDLASAAEIYLFGQPATPKLAF